MCEHKNKFLGQMGLAHLESTYTLHNIFKKRQVELPVG